MKTLKIVFSLLIANLQFGCTSTLVTKDGFHTSSNMKNVTWTPTSFHADEINNSTPTAALHTGISKDVMSAGSAGLFLLTK